MPKSSKNEATIKEQSLEAILPAIKFIHDVFHVSLLEQNTTRKRQLDENARQLDFEVGNDEEYKVEGIRDSAVYAKESEAGHPPGLYYLVSRKGYPKEESTWLLALAVQHLRKLIGIFHKDNPDKPTAISPPHLQWLDLRWLSLVTSSPSLPRPPNESAKNKK